MGPVAGGCHGEEEEKLAPSAALNDLVERTGISRREAGNVLTGQWAKTQLDVTAVPWLDAPELPSLIEDLVNKRAVDIDTYSPVELVEGHIEEQLLSNFRVQQTAVEDAYNDDPSHPEQIGVDLIVDGVGDVDWHVTQPTAGDVYAYGSEMEGTDDGPGLWQGSEHAAPMRVRLHAQYTMTTQRWTVEEIRTVDLDEAEVERRARDQDREDTRRQQALGLLPTDDELAEMADRAEREHVDGMTAAVRTLLEGVDDDVLRGDFLAGKLEWSLASAKEADPDRQGSTHTVIKAVIELRHSDRLAADADTLKAWVQQDSVETHIALAGWDPHPPSEGGDRQRIEATFVYAPKFDASVFRRRR